MRRLFIAAALAAAALAAPVAALTDGGTFGPGDAGPAAYCDDLAAGWCGAVAPAENDGSPGGGLLADALEWDDVVAPAENSGSPGGGG